MCLLLAKADFTFCLKAAGNDINVFYFIRKSFSKQLRRNCREISEHCLNLIITNNFPVNSFSCPTTDSIDTTLLTTPCASINPRIVVHLYGI